MSFGARPYTKPSTGRGGADPMLEGRVADLEEISSELVDQNVHVGDRASILGISEAFLTYDTKLASIGIGSSIETFAFMGTDISIPFDGSDTVLQLLEKIYHAVWNAYPGEPFYTRLIGGKIEIEITNGNTVAFPSSWAWQQLGLAFSSATAFFGQIPSTIDDSKVIVSGERLETAFEKQSQRLDAVNNAAQHLLRTAVRPETPVRERIVSQEEITTSGTWYKPSFEGFSGDDVLVIVRCVGGGAGGSVQATSKYGGLPGGVATRTFKLSDLNDEELIVVGAGGASNTTGGSTFFGGTTATDCKVLGYGGQSPVGSLPATISFYMRMRSEKQIPQMDLSGTGWSGQPDSKDGPAGGGAVGLADTTGGTAAVLYRAGRKIGGSNGTAGASVQDADFDAFGGGGGGAAAAAGGVGGAGGFPGGGGGAGSTTGGLGGNGCVRIQYLVREVK